MKQLISAAIILGAPAILGLTIVLGFSCFYAGLPAMWAGLAVLSAAAACCAVKKFFPAMWFYLAAALVLLVIYPKLEGFESYGREGRIRGMLSELRVKINDYKTKTGRWPRDGSALGTPAFELRQGHSPSSAIETVLLPPEAYLRPPGNSADPLSVKIAAAGSGEERLQYWGGDWREPVLLYPGGEYSYTVRREKDNALVSSGVINVPFSPGLKADSGGLVYDPAAGQIFINCTHNTRQGGKPWWWL